MLALSKTPICLGAIHVPSFTSDQGGDLAEIERYVIHNARVFAEGGFDGVFIQDQTPGSASWHTVAKMAALVRHTRSAVSGIELGLVLESDDPQAAFAIADASGASFIRLKVFVGAMVKAAGVVQAVGPQIEALRRAALADVTVLADIYDRTGRPLAAMPLGQACRQALVMGADGLILTGSSEEESFQMLAEARSAQPQARLFVGGGVTEQNAGRFGQEADGVIASSSLKAADGSHWDVEKIRRLRSLVDGK